MKSKHLILALAVASLFAAAGIAWTEYSHRPRAIVLDVDGMHCEGCAASVRQNLEKLSGASDIAISVEKGEVALTLDGWSETTRDEIDSAIESAGDYKVRE